MTASEASNLGATFDGSATRIAVFSSVAERVELCLYDDDGRQECVDLAERAGDRWHGTFPDVRPGRRYGFRVHGPWDPAAGHFCGGARLLLDPAARAVIGSPQWEPPLYPFDADNPDAPPPDVDTAPFVPRSVVIDPSFDWGDDHPPRTPWESSLLYEVHVKGFTARHPDIPPELRGTYAGFAHPAVVDHLNRLGVTAVELLPVFQFLHRRRLGDHGLSNYWGYDPISFFAPHNEYAAAADPTEQVREFKRMVRALHAAGIEVLLDVVYNHTCEGGPGGPVLAFRGLDNAAYYRLDPDRPGHYVDVTGTHNTLDTTHPEVRRLIVESLRYWVTEMHVDGFRFDLARVFLRGPGKPDESERAADVTALLDEIRGEPALDGVKLIAEPWDPGPDGYRLGKFPPAWVEWNDKFRDAVRDVWRGEPGSARELPARLAGSPDVFPPGDRTARASINFVTCHDGFTLHDLVSFEKKHNEANAEENRDGPDGNRSWNCGVEGPTDDSAVVELRARHTRNLLATLFLSNGVPMLLGGDEIGRTQRGNNNAYCQDNEVSWLDWEGADPELLRFVQALADLRRRHPAFRRAVWRVVPARLAGGPLAAGGFPEQPDETAAERENDAAPPRIEFFAADGEALTVADNGNPVPVQAILRAEPDDDDADRQADLVLLLNPTGADASFRLPESSRRHAWARLLDTSDATPPDDPPRLDAADPVTVASHAAVVLRRAAAR
jgi:glycogen operon protein